MKYLKLALAAFALGLSTNIHAAIVEVDLLENGDGLITRDTVSGLEWLDLTVTSNRSYDEVSGQLGLGGEFEGWRYATTAEVATFWDAFGGNSSFYNGFSTQNNGLFDAVAPYWGDLYCEVLACQAGEGASIAFTADKYINGNQFRAYLNDAYWDDLTINQDYATLSSWSDNSQTSLYIGSALVREVSPVPIPAAVWLFGSGLIGLAGMARRNIA